MRHILFNGAQLWSTTLCSRSHGASLHWKRAELLDWHHFTSQLTTRDWGDGLMDNRARWENSKIRVWISRTLEAACEHLLSQHRYGDMEGRDWEPVDASGSANLAYRVGKQWRYSVSNKPDGGDWHSWLFSDFHTCNVAHTHLQSHTHNHNHDKATIIKTAQYLAWGWESTGKLQIDEPQVWPGDLCQRRKGNGEGTGFSNRWGQKNWIPTSKRKRSEHGSLIFHQIR